MSSAVARRTLLVCGTVLALLALVALAARGHIAGAGGGQTRHIPSDLVLEYVLLLFALAAILVIPLLLLGMAQARAERSRYKRPAWMSWVSLVMLVALLSLITWRLGRQQHHGHQPRAAHGGQLPPKVAGHLKAANAAALRPLRFDWLPVIVVFSIALAGAGIAAYYFLSARRRRPPRAELAAGSLAAALDESLDDLRRERDARRAVIAAYARMERVLAASGLPRRAAEAPLEYLARVLSDLLHTSSEAVSRLTALFERARFSPHEIDPDLKEEAIEALGAIREELRAAS